MTHRFSVTLRFAPKRLSDRSVLTVSFAPKCLLDERLGVKLRVKRMDAPSLIPQLMYA